VQVQTKCPFCSGVNSVEVKEQDYNAWKSGVYAQTAFPYLSADQRELIMTGICCWDSALGDEE
jgi:hypothetical protein